MKDNGDENRQQSMRRTAQLTRLPVRNFSASTIIDGRNHVNDGILGLAVRVAEPHHRRMAAGPLTVDECFLEQARTEALTPPQPLTPLARAELLWSRRNPEGLAAEEGDRTLRLWNFSVGKSALKPEHEVALRSFLGVWLLSEQRTVDVRVVGSTSRTGGEESNAALSLRRAEAVASWLRGERFVNLRAEGRGERDASHGEEQEVLARDRAVLVTVDAERPIPPTLPPTWPVVPGPPLAPRPGVPVAFSEIRLSLDSPEFPVRIPPGRPLLVGKGKISGEVFIVDGNQPALGRVSALWNLNKKELSAQVSRPVSDNLKAKLDIGGARGTIQWTRLPLKPDVGFQIKPEFISAAVTMFEDSQRLNLYGGTLDVVVRWRVKFDLRPSDEVIARTGRFVAPAVTAVAKVAGPLAGPVGVGVGIVAIAIGFTASVVAEIDGPRKTSPAEPS